MKKTVVALAVSMAVALGATACGQSGAAGAGTTAAAAAAESQTTAAGTEAPAESGTETPESAEKAEETKSAESQAAESGAQGAAESGAEAAEEDGQNPVMNFVGVYSTEYNTEALVECEGTDGARITVTYAGSPWFHHQTVMSGKLDTETLKVEFSNAKMTEYTYNSDGSVDEETVAYTDGKGTAVFSMEDNTLTITEHFPSGDSETVYTWGPSSDMKTVTDPDHYEGVTAMDKAKIETVVAFNVRRAYLGENWPELADMIDYPIVINDTTLEDSDAFIGYMLDKTIDESDRQAMDEETTLDMFANGQGICMGSGQVWLNDPNYMTDKAPELKIIAISGIVPRGN